MLNYYSMGQYFKVVNLDKKEYLNPGSFGAGAKLGENWETLNEALNNLLAQRFHPEHGWERDAYLGRWAGDRITIIGDADASGIYQQLNSKEYMDISKAVVEFFGFRVIDFTTLVAERMRAHPFGVPPHMLVEDIRDPFEEDEE